MKNFYSKIYGLQPGDRIVEPLFQTGILKHHAIFLGADSDGIEYVGENRKFHNVQIVTAAEYFSKAKTIDRIIKFNGSNTQRRQVVQKAMSLAGKSYDLINYNCEHFANEVRTGKAFSNQVENAFAM